MDQKQIDVLRHVNRISLLHRLRVQNMLSDTGVWGSQIPILLHVERNPGCTQTDIAEHLGVSSPSIATSIKRLQKAGMLEKRADEADMRRNHIELTERGRSTVARGRACYDQVVEQMLRDFTGSEVDTLVSLLARLEENLAGDEYRGRTALSLAEAADRPAKSDGEEREHP